MRAVGIVKPRAQPAQRCAPLPSNEGGLAVAWRQPLHSRPWPWPVLYTQSRFCAGVRASRVVWPPQSICTVPGGRQKTQRPKGFSPPVTFCRGQGTELCMPSKACARRSGGRLMRRLGRCMRRGRAHAHGRTAGIKHVQGTFQRGAADSETRIRAPAGYTQSAVRTQAQSKHFSWQPRGRGQGRGALARGGWREPRAPADGARRGARV